MQKKKKTALRSLVYAAAIAALYVLLTWLSSLFGLSGTALIQVRVSEALTVLPVFTFSAVPGLTVGCLLANLLTGAMPTDVLFGTLATLAGALGSWLLRRRPVLAPLAPILSNALVIPPVLMFAYGMQEGYWLLLASVAAGEIVSCGILGLALYGALRPIRGKIFC